MDRLAPRLERIGVLGAGTMGAGIAALAASAGLQVELLDVPGSGSARDQPATTAITRQLEARPAAFMLREHAARIRAGNIEDHLERLSTCDWVIEAVVERLDVKQALYAQLESVLRPDAVITTNTSSIRMELLLDGRSDSFCERFLGTHFFNPPRYLHLLELIPAEHTAAAAIELVQGCGELVLGKGVILARDTPGFVGNRIGVHGIVRAICLMDELGLSIDDVDVLCGPLIGRPRSAIFRTSDLTGIDVLAYVTGELERGTGEDFALPAWVHALVRGGRLGQKTGAGFYRRADDGGILTLDPAGDEYRPRQRPLLDELGALHAAPLLDRIRGALALPGAHGEFMRRYLAETTAYARAKTDEIAYERETIDRAMRWGFAFEQGPIELADALDGTSSYTRAHRPGVIAIAECRMLAEGDDWALVDLGERVACFTVRTRLNTIGDSVLGGLARSLALVAERGLAGLVIGNDDPRAFSAGADLARIARLADEGEWDDLDDAVRRFQAGTMKVRQAPFPVVAAPFGLTFGGGCELCLHADAIQAHAELAIGLVETGVGLLPAGGGTKELLMRFSRELAPYRGADPFDAASRAFLLIGLAQRSTSAPQARAMGFLRDRDRITMNRDRLLADARQAVLALTDGYVAPLPAVVETLGDAAIGNLRATLAAMRMADRISDHDVLIGEELALVLSGGSGLPRTVTEADLLDLEREAFLRLLRTRPTRERIAYTLKTGKPLRN